MGSISSGGVYTAPSSIAPGQTVTIIGTSPQVDGVTTTGTATITLVPNAPTISVDPATVTLTSGQTQQYDAAIANLSNTAVTWTMSPTGTGILSASGLYTAPPVISSPQTITITATSQAMPSLTASAVLTLQPAQCAAKSYSYVRSIVIDHTKVPGTDQPNFPFYFAVTDPLLASTSKGGHMASPNGYDIEFSSDPAGQQILSYEIEQYNPVTGQISAWVRVPNLSHSTDTVIYMLYGNPAITAPQQNPNGVWGANYAAVYQLDNVQPGAALLPDSTSNGNEAWSYNVQPAAGLPGGQASFDGATSFIGLPTNDFASNSNSGSNAPIFNASFAVWFKTASSGVILGQTSNNGYIPALYIDTNGRLRANFYNFQNAEQIVSPSVYSDGNWHYAVLAFDTTTETNYYPNGVLSGVSSTTSGNETLYVDGQVIGSQSGAVPGGFSPANSYYLGTGYVGNSWDWDIWPATSSNNDSGWFYFNGSLDKVQISSIARSSGWVQSEYNNQSSPSTFFELSAEAGSSGSVNPHAVTLYQSQSQQFTVLQTGLCNAGDAVWSMPAGSPGALSPTGLYIAPTTINTQQTVTVTATTLGASSAPLNATITLMPPVAITVAPGVASLPTGGTQQFTATVSNTNNTGVTWSLDPVGVGSISSTGLYTAPATLNGQQTVSVNATSLADPTQSASATVTLGVAVPLASTITINPQTALLYVGQTQQFSASLTNGSSPAVTWSVSPIGAGNIDASGNYTVPAMIAAQQTVTITATSQADSAVTATATVSLAPAKCATSGYSYVRAITIDHTKVPNTDQVNFPFLFSDKDPLLATTANGGHVTNSKGYDIIFTSDPVGQTPLNYEMEQYNPATGQVIAWVQIPTLSHTSNTTIYLFYGNSSVTTSQQNPAATWDANYIGVWHLGNGSLLSLNDSTSNANNAMNDGSLAAPGPFAGGMSTNGSTYATIGTPASLTNLAQGPATFSAWVYSAVGNGGIIMGKDDGNNVAGWSLALNSNHNVDFAIVFSGYDIKLHSSAATGNNVWSYVTATVNGSATGSATATVYVNGVPSGTVTGGGGTTEDDSAQVAYLANATYSDQASGPFKGSTAEFRISNTIRSADWIATEYNNQNSPSTFFALSSEGSTGVTPETVTLYASQSQQFTSPGLCSAGVTWSLPAGATGTLTASGLYTAPSAIPEQQTVTVMATSQANSDQSASATVTLMPSVSVTMSPASITLNQNQNQQFAAIVNNSTDPAVTWTMSPAGLGSLDQNGGYIAPSSITTQQTVTVTATSVTDPTKSASAMITLAPSICASTGYGNQRVIVIDHTKVANTDQINFPFLFNTTDPEPGHRGQWWARCQSQRLRHHLQLRSQRANQARLRNRAIQSRAPANW